MQRTNVPVMAAIRPADEPGRASRRVLTCRARPGTADPARPGAQLLTFAWPGRRIVTMRFPGALLTIAAAPDQHVACIVAAVIRRAESALSDAIQADSANTRIHN
jgi:hypothetical protein